MSIFTHATELDEQLCQLGQLGGNFMVTEHFSVTELSAVCTAVSKSNRFVHHGYIEGKLAVHMKAS